MYKDISRELKKIPEGHLESHLSIWTEVSLGFKAEVPPHSHMSIFLHEPSALIGCVLSLRFGSCHGKAVQTPTWTGRRCGAGGAFAFPSTTTTVLQEEPPRKQCV